jgi:hypothetical protein
MAFVISGIFAVVPGAGLGEGKENRRGTQMNAEERRGILSPKTEVPVE